MDNKFFKEITKKHSTTFYYASLFFSTKIKNDVYVLYAFLRFADDLVDEKNDKQAFFEFKNQVYLSLDKKEISKNVFVRSFSKIFCEYNFNKAHLDSLFGALESDFSNPLQIKTQKDLEEYIYGVAGVVGLMMAKIMGLPDSSSFAAREFGEQMQIINILRDIKEDQLKKRVYLPKEDLLRFGLNDILEWKNKKIEYEKLIRFEIEKVLKKIDALSDDIKKIPLRYRIPIKISRDVYLSIAKKIYKEPTLVWETRVHVTKAELFKIILKNLI